MCKKKDYQQKLFLRKLKLGTNETKILNWLLLIWNKRNHQQKINMRLLFHQIGNIKIEVEVIL